MTTVGVISDTHGHLDPRVLEVFAGVDHILHAGDIGPPGLVRELERIAPVTAVLGNCDCGDEFRETEVVALGGRTFVVRHVVDPHVADPSLASLLKRHRPDVVVFGHTHRPSLENRGGVLYFNPGSAGRQRFTLPRTVGILRCDGRGVRATHHQLR